MTLGKASTSCLLQQNQASRTQELTDSAQKEADVGNEQMDQDHQDVEEDKVEQQDPTADNTDHKQSGSSSKSHHSHKLQERGTIIIVRNCFLINFHTCDVAPSRSMKCLIRVITSYYWRPCIVRVKLAFKPSDPSGQSFCQFTQN